MQTDETAEATPARPGRQATAFAVGVGVVGILPVALVGGLAVQLREELGFGQAGLGQAIAAFFTASALASAPGGRIIQRIGARRSLLACAAGSAVALLGIGGLARSFAGLVAFLVLGGVAMAGAQISGDFLLVRGVPANRQGLAFGLKQSAIPIATLLAGIAVPLVAVTVGWRWAFAGAAVGAIAAAVASPRDLAVASPPSDEFGEEDAGLAPMSVLAAAGGLGAASATCLLSFLTDSAVAGGLSPPLAGLLLALGSVSGIAVRVVAGVLADRRGERHLRVVWKLLGAGSLGFALLSAGGVPVAVVAGTLLAFGAGWGWQGLYSFAVVRLNAHAPARASGLTISGVFAGSVIGPPVFGVVVERASYSAAWLGASVVALSAALLTIVAVRLLSIDIERRRAEPHDD